MHYDYAGGLDGGKICVQNCSKRLLKISTEEPVTTEAGSLLPYLTTLTEEADHLRRRINIILGSTASYLVNFE